MTTADMLTAPTVRRAAWLTVGALAFTAVSAAGQESGDAGWYPAIRAKIAELQTEILSQLDEADIPEGARAQARAQVEGNVQALLRNLHTEIAGVESRLSAAQLEHSPQADHFCSTENIGGRLIERVIENPADAGNALTAAAQCREAYWGAVSVPVSEELEDMRNLCMTLRDSIGQPREQLPATWTPESDAIYALARCASWRGAASVRYSLTGSHYKELSDAYFLVLELTLGIINREYRDR